MLKCIAIVVYIMIVIIRITQKAIFFSKYERRVHIRHWQARFSWVSKGKHIFTFIVQISAVFIAQVGSSLFVAYHLMRRFHPYGSVATIKFIFLSAIFFKAW